MEDRPKDSRHPVQTKPATNPDEETDGVGCRRFESQIIQVLEKLPIPVFIQTNRKFSYLNPKAVELFGASDASALIGKPVTDQVHPDYRDAALARIRHLNEDRLPVEARTEVVFFRMDGTTVWGETSGEPVIFDGENGALVFVQDITERKIAEKQLRANEEMFRTIADYAADWESWFDPSGSLIWVNPYAERITGYTPEEMLEMPDFFTTLVHPDDRKKALHQISMVFDGREPAGENYEVRIIRKDGKALWLSINWQAIVDENGRNLGIRSSGRDVTDRKIAEAQNRQWQDLMRYIIEHDPNAIAVHDNDLRYIFVSRRYLEDYGVREEDVIGKFHYDVFPDIPEKWKEVHRRALAGEVLSAKEDRFERMDGTVDYANWECRPWYHQDGTIGGIILYTEVVTERKRAQQEKAEMEEQLRQAQKLESLGRLAGGVAHDFNNMLSIINGYAEISMEMIDDSDPLRGNIGEILRAGKRSSEIVRQLLAFARRQTISPVRMNMNDIVSGMLRMLQRLIGENIELFWNPGGNLRPVKMDPSQIDQILANLVVNARDAIEDVGRITIETKNVEIDEDYCRTHAEFITGSFVMLAVSDDGCGMDETIRENLFEPFFTSKPTGKGTGLGLPTVYGIVKQNKGFVNVYSEPGQGTTFRIYIPCIPEEMDTTPDHEEKAISGGAETILLVEDEPAILTMGRTMLQKMGYTVLSAGRPGEARKIAAGHSGAIDLLITDVIMPSMNGRELAGLIQAIHPEMKVLFMSGYTADVIGTRGELDKELAFIHKPFSMNELSAAIRKALAER